MKIVSDKTLKNGKRRITIELTGDKNTKFMAFNEDRFYQLGGQVDDVHRGHVFTESQEVYWDGLTQEWQES